MSTILTLYSVEEHIGKTTFAINLGVSLINETQKSVALLDLSAPGNGLSAASMLKLKPLHLLSHSQVTSEQITDHVQQHSSRLSVLTFDSGLVQKSIFTREFAVTLFSHLRTQFEYILVDPPIQIDQVCYEVIELSEIVIFLSTSAEQEFPIEILGKPKLRHIVTMTDTPDGHAPRQDCGYYILPKDVLAQETFQGSGIPFVIQAPYRPISQIIARLARDIGQKRLGIALMGGAALGLAQLGMLSVFEQNRIVPDMIAGTGFGAFIGAAYALGTEWNQFTRCLSSWALAQTYFSRVHSFLFRGRLFKEKGLQALFDTFLKDVYFEELQIPFNVTAVNMRTGQGVIFREGKILDAIKLSMRISGLFVPFKHTERYLIDSSPFLATQVPPLQRMGADMVLVVQAPRLPEGLGLVRKKKKRWGTSKHLKGQPQELMAAAFDGLMEYLEIPEDSSAEQQMTPDVIITPDFQGISWRDFYRIDTLIEAGSNAAEGALPLIETLKWGNRG